MKRNFCLGSEWLYYKIYTGVKTADLVLSQKLHPVISDLKQQGAIDQWFFIRYKDPEEHLRLRLHCATPEKTALVIQTLYPIFDELLQNDLVWKLQTDTYNREIERYGTATMEVSESLFYWDSEMVVQYTALKPYFGNPETELFFSLFSIDAFLEGFSLTVAEKCALADELQLAFKKEFNADKVLKKEFDKNFRGLAPKIDAFGHVGDELQAELVQLVAQKQQQLQPLILFIKENLQVALFDFLQSHIHMMVNRQFTSKQRQYECLIYDHLHRHYKKKTFFKSQPLEPR
ncbi:thiopeptide-type bacteriocin biosynthesis protein [Flavobacterium sp.]|uniref:thiopeptide-type bacteriocin biosynthesis protein n=1 Tax=Flavobacterium sp. TaxID=239 RepID=UPI0039E59F7D